MNERLVIDASVAAKWFLKDALETDIDLADDVLVAFLSGDLELHAPRIFTYEISGLLTRACRHRLPASNGFRLTKDQAVRCTREIFELPIRHAGISVEEATEAIEMALDYSKTHYDMTYVRLANVLDCQWCTADEKVLDAIPKSFPRNRVLLLNALRTAP